MGGVVAQPGGGGVTDVPSMHMRQILHMRAEVVCDAVVIRGTFPISKAAEAH